MKKTIYALVDKVFNSYGDPIKILTNQGKNNSWGVSKFV
jgi:hypothetical protein